MSNEPTGFSANGKGLHRCLCHVLPTAESGYHPGTDASDNADPCSELSTLLAPGVNHSRCEAHQLEMAPRNLAIGLVTTS